MLIENTRTKDFSRQNPAPYWSTRSPKPRPPRPTPSITQTRTPPTSGPREEREARATWQSISDCSPRPKTTDDRVTVARPSDGPTEPSRRSRGADPALERETNKYRLMSLGRAAPMVNARLPLTESNVVSEDCGRGRGPS